MGSSECIARRTRSAQKHVGLSKRTDNSEFEDSVSVIGNRRGSRRSSRNIVKEEDGSLGSGDGVSVDVHAEEEDSLSEEKKRKQRKSSEKIVKEKDGVLGFGEWGSVDVHTEESLIANRKKLKLKLGPESKFGSSNGVMNGNKNSVKEGGSVCVDEGGGGDCGLIVAEETRVSVDEAKPSRVPCVATRTRSKSEKPIKSPVCFDLDVSQFSGDGDGSDGGNDDDVEVNGDCNIGDGGVSSEGDGGPVCVEGGDRSFNSAEETWVSVDEVKPSRVPCVATRTRSKSGKQTRSPVCINLDDSQSFEDGDGNDGGNDDGVEVNGDCNFGDGGVSSDRDDDDCSNEEDDDCHYQDCDYIVTEDDDGFSDDDGDDESDYEDSDCMVSEDDANDCETKVSRMKNKRVCEPETVICPTCCKETTKETVQISVDEEETPIPFYKICIGSRTRLQSDLQSKKHEGTVNGPIVVDGEEIESLNVGNGDDNKDDVGMASQETDVETGEKEMHCNCESMGTCVKRRKFVGSENVIDLEDSENEFRVGVDQNAYTACRTRCQIHLRSKEKFRNTSHPMAGEGKREKNDDRDSDDNYDSSSDENNDEDDEHANKEKVEGISQDGKKTHSRNDDFLCELIMKNMEAQAKQKLSFEGKFIPQEVTPSKNEMLLPLRFSFADEEAKEKPYSEKELETLWEDFNYALSYDDVGSFCSSAIDSEQTTKLSESETRSSLPCNEGGEHSWIYDDKIGKICRFCKNVVLEIKYIVPSIVKSSGKSGKKTSDDEVDLSTLCGFHFQESNEHSRASGVPSSGSVWDIVPGIQGSMYPHQQEAFEFIWRNLAGSNLIEELKPYSNDVGGCVISHAPGTGKTRLTIAFLQTFMKVFPELRPIIVAPCNLLPMWKNEFKKWNVYIPIHNLNSRELSGREDGLFLKVQNGKALTTKYLRLLKLHSWLKGRSILLVSYSLFEKLTGHTNQKKRKLAEHRHVRDNASKLMQEILLQSPGLLVLDEGHTARNKDSGIWKSLKMVKTELRIMLSGTPFQNNFDELFNTLYVVRRKFADSYDSVLETNIEKREARLRRIFAKTVNVNEEPEEGYGKKLQLFRSIVDHFIHVHEGAILKKLPGLRDYIILLHPTPLQKIILEKVKRNSKNFKLEQKVSLITLHPSLLTKCGSEDEPIIEEHKLKTLKKNPAEGVKLRFVLELIRLSIARKEKVLVFSLYLEPISFITEHLISVFHWTEGKEVLQLDGSIRDAERRQESIENFNNSKSTSKVLLASIKACSEGINLIGASRVVLLDVVWNPAVGRQAISRAYRIGQEKFVHAYHLITSETKEEIKYVRHAKKDSLSKMLFSSTDGHNAKQKTEPKICEDDILGAIVKHDKLKDMFKDIYTPMESSYDPGTMAKKMWIGSTISEVLDNMVAVNV